MYLVNTLRSERRWGLMEIEGVVDEYGAKRRVAHDGTVELQMSVIMPFMENMFAGMPEVWQPGGRSLRMRLKVRNFKEMPNPRDIIRAWGIPSVLIHRERAVLSLHTLGCHTEITGRHFDSKDEALLSGLAEQGWRPIQSFRPIMPMIWRRTGDWTPDDRDVEAIKQGGRPTVYFPSATDE